VADVTCTDARLPEYVKDGQGMSLVLVRSPTIQKIVKRGQGVRLDPIPVERVVQSLVGVVAIKRQYLVCRLFLNGEGAPKKRVAPERPKNPFLRKEAALKDRMRVTSRELWNTEERDAKRIRGAMRPDLERLAVEGRISKIIMLPVRTLWYIRRRQ
jgi:coenzyme F420 hydrogenase subunit beta